MIARATSRLLVVAGLAMLGWSAFVLVDGSVAQRMARRSLEAAASSAPPTPATRPSFRKATVHAAPVTEGAALATLSIPQLDLSAVVLQGSDARTLRHGPGHLENTAMPGEPGNVVIAGHRDTFFRPLRNVAVGDDVFLDGPGGRVHYRVASTRVVDPHDLSVLARTDSDVLTLITCYPFWVLGNAPDRFVVRATRVGEIEPTRSTPALAPRSPVAPVATTPPRVAVASGRPIRWTGDDDPQIRDAVGRFELAYNARIARHPDESSAGPLAFTACDVSVTGESGSAVCETAAPARSERVWVFTIARAGDTWSIRSIASR